MLFLGSDVCVDERTEGEVCLSLSSGEGDVLISHTWLEDAQRIESTHDSIGCLRAANSSTLLLQREVDLHLLGVILDEREVLLEDGQSRNRCNRKLGKRSGIICSRRSVRHESFQHSTFAGLLVGIECSLRFTPKVKAKDLRPSRAVASSSAFLEIPSLNLWIHIFDEHLCNLAGLVNPVCTELRHSGRQVGPELETGVERWQLVGEVEGLVTNGRFCSARAVFSARADIASLAGSAHLGRHRAVVVVREGSKSGRRNDPLKTPLLRAFSASFCVLHLTTGLCAEAFKRGETQPR